MKLNKFFKYHCDAYFITLKRREDRVNNVKSIIANDLFASHTVVNAVDKLDLSIEDTKEFYRKANAEWEMEQSLPRDVRLYGVERWVGGKEHLFERPSSRSLYTGTYACYLSHIKAIETALSDENNSEYIVIIEDDAQFNNVKMFDYIDSVDIFTKPDITVFGGAVKMASYASEENRFEQLLQGFNVAKVDRIPSDRPKSIRQRYITTMYALRRETAYIFLDTVKKHQMPIDASWWYAFAKLSTFKYNPCLIRQDTMNIEGARRDNVGKRKGVKNA